MKRVVIGLFLVLLAAVPASASPIWSLATVSDDNGGLFLLGATSSAVGTTFVLDLPSYSTTSQFGFPPNQVDLAVTASAMAGQQIVSLSYTFLGSFTGLGSAGFLVTANAGSSSGVFSTSPKTGTVSFAGASSVNFGAILNLDDGGDSAAVRRIQFDVVETPEPATMVLLGTGLAALVGCMKVHRRRTLE